MRAEIIPHPPSEEDGLPMIVVIADTQEEWYFLRLYNQLFNYGRVSIRFESPDSEKEDE